MAPLPSSLSMTNGPIFWPTSIMVPNSENCASLRGGFLLVEITHGFGEIHNPCFLLRRIRHRMAASAADASESGLRCFAGSYAEARSNYPGATESLSTMNQD